MNFSFFIENVPFFCRHKKYEAILRVLHFADNNLNDNTDPYYKIRSLFDQINRSPKYVKNEKNFSVDESMVPYFGHHHTKQYLRLKPIK